MEQRPIFSFVVPAHNEELYIGETLQSLRALEYPEDSYEVIVIENGSTDSTADAARQNAAPNVQIYSEACAGVSAARNAGIMHARADADWIIFLDADTRVASTFLAFLVKKIDRLNAKEGKPFVAGTVSLRPWPQTPFMEFWYWWSNFGMQIRNSGYAGLLIVKRELLASSEKGIKFDETMRVGEDLRFVSEARALGRVFFLWTNLAHTSTRRFANGGWRKIPVWVGMWLFAMMVPIHVQRRFKYEIVR